MSTTALPGVDVTLAELAADPFPIYKQLRRETPVARLDSVGHLCLVTRWSDVLDILVDDDTFSARTPQFAPPTYRDNILFTDGEEHAGIRAVMQPGFQPRQARDFAEAKIPPLAHGLIDSFEQGGKADLVDRLTEPLAALIIRSLLSLDDVPLDDMRRWFKHIGVFLLLSTSPSQREAAQRTVREID